jgi:hypothetical protein
LGSTATGNYKGADRDMRETIPLILKSISEIVAVLIAVSPLFIANQKIKQGLRCQLRSEMLRIYYENKDDKKIRQFEYENFVKLYEAYKALKGNSFIDKIYDEVKKYEIVT